MEITRPRKTTLCGCYWKTCSECIPTKVPPNSVVQVQVRKLEKKKGQLHVFVYVCGVYEWCMYICVWVCVLVRVHLGREKDIRGL